MKALITFTRSCSMAGLLLAAGAASVLAQAETPLSVRAHWRTDEFQSSRATLDFSLSRALAAAERLAVLIGTLDVSGLLELRGQRVRYQPTALRLPAGELEVVAYLVSAGEWQEVVRFPLKVRTAAGFDGEHVVPVIDLSSTGQLAARTADDESRPPGAYQHLSLRAGFEGVVTRHDWQISTQANALGVTEPAQRLRWSELQGAAPAIDLSDYRIRVAEGRSHLTLGNVTAGSQRYLLNNFGSRGLATALAAGSFATLDAAVLNGTNAVGWSNLSGLARPAHQVVSATLSLEALPARPGGLHVGISGLKGSVLPLTSVNQGAVTDAEKSGGLGLEVALSDAQQRIRFTGGWARSRFSNPVDPLLSGDTTLVPVQPTVRSARHAELAMQMLRAFPLASSIHAALGVTVRHERVDPLYRSIGNAEQSDLEHNGIELTGSLGALSLQGSATESRDNLADIASILTAHTHTRSVTATLPLGALLRAATVWYWPALNASWQHTHQFGAGLPTDGDFSAAHIPDQVSTNESASLSWSRGSSGLSYRWNRSFQDNRQSGRERADFRTVIHGLTVNVSPHARVASTMELSLERQSNIENGMMQELQRLGATLQWQLARYTALSGSLSTSAGRDPLSAQTLRNTENQLELSQGFNLYRQLDSGTQGRLFLRYGRTRAAVRPFEPVSLLAPTITWTLNAGGSLRLW